MALTELPIKVTFANLTPYSLDVCYEPIPTFVTLESGESVDRDSKLWLDGEAEKQKMEIVLEEDNGRLKLIIWSIDDCEGDPPKVERAR